MRSRLLLTTLRVTRVPARLAGLGALQDFLERGFSAFHHMQGSQYFVNTIVRREREILERIFAGHDSPFDLQGDSRGDLQGDSQGDPNGDLRSGAR